MHLLSLQLKCDDWTCNYDTLLLRCVQDWVQYTQVTPLP